MKQLLGASLIALIGVTSAQAGINVDIGIGQPGYYTPVPSYIEPVPIYVPNNYGYGNDHHHNYDWNYWHQNREVRYIEEHHDDERGDRGAHLDNDKRGYQPPRGNKGRGNGKSKGRNK
jgi:hypothetical protein